ncbi:MAG: hypothetical protein D6731_13725, partial [Planctomycetota bacterium]
MPERSRCAPALLLGAVASLSAQVALAQPSEPSFGMEFEFAGAGNRIVRFEEMPFENYREILSAVVEHYGGRPSEIRKVTFTKPTTNLERYPSGERELFRAEWTDPRGRTWRLEPEFVASTGYDGYELVTPPLEDPRELEEVLEQVRASGLVREGRRSGVHLTVDARRLVTPDGDARALANLILLHENAQPLLRRLFNPVRGGGYRNYFSRDLGVDHLDLLREIDRLPENERTAERLAELFRRREGREAALHEADPTDPVSWSKLWKYRSLNLAKALELNPLHDGSARLVEFRMFDLADPETHRLEAELYRRMVARAAELAERGERVRLERQPTPEGADPAEANLPRDPAEARAEARAFIEGLGLDPAAYEPLLERNFQPRAVPGEREFRGLVDGLPEGRIEHNGEPFTYGFEFEGRGADIVNLTVPTDPEVARRWGSMTVREKKAYYRRVVGDDPHSVEDFFEPDVRRHPWLDPYWYVEGTGNWELHSRVLENLAETAEAMRKAKELAGKSGKGFHLHMRDNAPDWERLEANGSRYADFLERASNWIYLKRVERLRTDLSLKSWSNARLSPGDVENIADLGETGRATLRVAEVNRGDWGGEDYIDLEIRGLTKYVDDVEVLAKLFANAMRTGNFGPWSHTDNPMPTAGGGYWGGDRVPNELSFAERVGEYLRTVEGREMSPETREILEGLQGPWSSRAGGENRAYATGVATPLLPWGEEAALPEPDRRAARYAQEEFLGWLNRYAERIAAGEFGVDLSIASAEGLERALGVTPEEARALVAFRRGGGTLTPEAVARVLALRGGSGRDAARVARLDGVDLNAADERTLRSDRFGLSANDARRLLDYRDAHGVDASLRRAGVSPAERARLLEAAAAFDLSAPAATAEAIAERTPLSPEVARRVVAYRDAHPIRGEADLLAAGLDEFEAREVLEAVSEGFDPNRLSAEELARRLGVTPAKARALVEAREAAPFRRWAEVAEFLSPAAERKLRERFRTLRALGAADRAALLAAGLTPGQAERLILRRDANDLRDLRVLASLLGETAARRAALRMAGLDPARSSFDRMVEAGLDEDVARRIVDYRDAHLLGRGSEAANYEARRAVDMLVDEGIVSYGQRDALLRAVEAVDLASAKKSVLTRRLGLDGAVADAFLAYRDAHRLTLANLKKAGLSEARAKKVLAAAKALDLGRATPAEIAARTGLSLEAARALKARAELGYGSISAEELVRAGLSRAAARRIVAAREAARAAGGIDYKEVVRRLRLRVRKWVRDTNLSDALLRTLLPAEAARVSVVRPTAGEGEGFAAARRAAPGPLEPSRVPYEVVAGVFAAVRNGAVARFAARAEGATGEAERANLARGRETLDALRLEIVETNDLLADRRGEAVRVSTGVLNEIDRRAEALPEGERAVFRSRVLGLILAHEAAHAGGLGSEKLADVEAVEILKGARGIAGALGLDVEVAAREVRAAVDVFARPLGAAHVDSFFARLRERFRYGSPGRRASDLERAVAGEPVDRLARWRRADGTLDWKRMTRDGALREAGGTAHFALALFLKELAVVVRTGDRLRIEEFFDGLMTTDFYAQYGMFVIGARAGEVAYVRYLERYVKLRFVNGVLKSNLVLAAGLALPEIVGGTFTGKTFAISLTSLGLASAAVKSGLSAIRWVTRLGQAREAGTLARTGLAASRLARAGAWFYTAAELGVILFVAEDIDHAISGWLDRREARDALADASYAFFAAVGRPDATPEAVAEAARDYHAAWTNYRDFLYAPLHAD